MFDFALEWTSTTGPVTAIFFLGRFRGSVRSRSKVEERSEKRISIILRWKFYFIDIETVLYKISTIITYFYTRIYG